MFKKERARTSSQAKTPPQAPRSGQSRRRFLKGVLAAGAAANVSLVPGRLLAQSVPASAGTGSEPQTRQQRAYNLRVQAAAQEAQRPLPTHENNGDEDRYPKKIASFSKGLPHNNLGEVDLSAYQVFLNALDSGSPNDFEKIPMGTTDQNHRYVFVNPQAGLAYDLEGADSHALDMPPAPAFGSSEMNAEMVEVYWMALTRDVPFSEYDTNPLTQQAAADLTRLGDAFKGPKVNGQVTTGTLFRDNLPGCLVGPYNSQFRYLSATMGANYIEQRMQTVQPNQDFLTDFAEWLRVQNAGLPSVQAQLDPTLRFIRSGRDAAWWVHQDTIDQAAFIAMMVLLYPLAGDVEGGLTTAPYNPGNPYNRSANQTGFGTFGIVHINSLLPEVASRAIKAVRFQKFFVHRRLRPEEYGGRIHSTLTGAAQYPVNAAELQQSPALQAIHDRFGSYLLPQVFPEGAPLHPSYGQGHGVVAGACITILKAFFDGSFVIPRPVVPSPDGTSLVPYTGPDAGQMTVGGELNKLASNIYQSRNMAGVHYRSDGLQGLLLGEALAISILRDQRPTYNENRDGFFQGFTFTKFDGTTITI